MTTGAEMIEELGVMAIAVNRLVEYVKKTVLEPYVTNDGRRKVLTLTLSLVLGVFAAVGAGMNIFAGETAYAVTLSPIVGQIVTGLALGFGANFVDLVWGLLYGHKQPAQG
jgi:hypothetical protein